MKRKRARFGAVLAAGLTASGCATTHLSGEYRPHVSSSMTADSSSDGRETIGKHSKWLFFWGLLDTRDFDTTSDFKSNVKEGYVVRDVVIKDRESIGGFFLWLITAGIVNHHTVVIKGRPVEAAPEAIPEAPSR